MKAEVQSVAMVVCPSRTAPVGRVFTYPTRLLEAWQPGMMIYDLPADHKPGHTVELVTQFGSTRSLGYPPRHPFKALYQRVMPDLDGGDRPLYDSRYETDGNIAHILAIILPEVLISRQKVSDLTVILRANATAMARNVYQALGIPTLSTDRAVRGQLVCRGSALGAGYESLYASLFQPLQFEGYQAQTPERIFISRKGNRRLINEPEVEAFLADYGFQKVYFEDIPIAQQWSLCRNARVVVGLHGAALANLLFSRSGYKLVELFHPGYVVNMYRNITHQMGGQWAGVVGQITPDVIQKLDREGRSRAFALASTRIHLDSLKAALAFLDIEKADLSGPSAQVFPTDTSGYDGD